MFISDQGSVWACGWSADGQTGLGHYKNTDRISKCVGDIVGEKVIKVASSADCVLALNGIIFLKLLLLDPAPHVQYLNWHIFR